MSEREWLDPKRSGTMKMHSDGIFYGFWRCGLWRFGIWKIGRKQWYIQLGPIRYRGPAHD